MPMPAPGEEQQVIFDHFSRFVAGHLRGARRGLRRCLNFILAAEPAPWHHCTAWLSLYRASMPHAFTMHPLHACPRPPTLTIPAAQSAPPDPLAAARVDSHGSRS